MPAVEVEYNDPEAPIGAIVGAAEIVDQNLVPAGETIVRSAQPVRVAIARPGRYLIRGSLPTGGKIEGTVDVGDAAPPTATALIRTPGDETRPRGPLGEVS